jgi:amino acid transporter
MPEATTQSSHYPIAGAPYQYGKYNVDRRYGWFVGWFYGIARGAADRAE